MSVVPLSRRLRRVAAALLGLTVLAACSAAAPRRVEAGPTIALPRPASPVPSSASAAPKRPLLELPVTPAGQRPPQFVVVSFDGSGGRPLWKYWQDATRAAGAHATFFLSAVYLLTPQARLAYHPPRHTAGYSDIGFGITPNGSNPKTEIEALMTNLTTAYDDGNEIGTHFGGHFCTPYAGNVATWNASDWKQEIDQVHHLIRDVVSDNALPPSTPALPFPPSEVIGGRSPCLEGNLPQLHQAEVAEGFRYDATDNARFGQWPFRQNGLWNMPLSLLPVAGAHYSTLSSDYNMYANQSAGVDAPPAKDKAYGAQALATWRAGLAASYSGDRAPLSLGNHFEDWNGDAYRDALSTLMLQECRQPEVHCVSYEELADWLDREPPAALASFQAGDFPKGPELKG